MPEAAIAAIAALAYGAVSWFTGDLFPFSRYSMYAKLRGRTEGAVLYVEVDGVERPFHEVVAWSGIDPERIRADGVPCSLHWVVLETQRWVRQHQAELADGAEVVVGWHWLRVAPDGGLEHEKRPFLRGRGRLR